MCNLDWISFVCMLLCHRKARRSVYSRAGTFGILSTSGPEEAGVSVRCRRNSSAAGRRRFHSQLCSRPFAVSREDAIWWHRWQIRAAWNDSCTDGICGPVEWGSPVLFTVFTVGDLIVLF